MNRTNIFLGVILNFSKLATIDTDALLWRHHKTQTEQCKCPQLQTKVQITQLQSPKLSKKSLVWELDFVQV